MGARRILGDIAAEEIQKSGGGAEIEWTAVEDRVIAVSLALDQSLDDVAETLCLYSPGAVTKDEQARIAERVDQATAALQHDIEVKPREPNI